MSSASAGAKPTTDAAAKKKKKGWMPQLPKLPQRKAPAQATDSLAAIDAGLGLGLAETNVKHKSGKKLTKAKAAAGKKAVKRAEQEARKQEACTGEWTNPVGEKWCSFMAHYGPVLLLLLAILMVKQTPAKKPNETAEEATKRKVAHGQVLLGILMVLAASQMFGNRSANFKFENKLKNYEWQAPVKKVGKVGGGGSITVNSYRVASSLALLIAGLGAYGASLHQNTNGMMLNIGMAILGIWVALGARGHCHLAVNKPITFVYNYLEQLENMPGLSSMITAALLVWIVMQLTNIRFAYPAVGGQKIYYPDEQKPKSKGYYSVRMVELVAVALIFMASKADHGTTTSVTLENIFTRVSSLFGSGTRTYWLLLALLVLCGGYMFAYKGYESFAVDSALLGLVMVGYHGHVQGASA